MKRKVGVYGGKDVVRGEGRRGAENKGGRGEGKDMGCRYEQRKGQGVGLERQRD